ncbi:MAG: flagellar basal body rod C-terminal domain-containing protein, partial [Turicibacter sp.]
YVLGQDGKPVSYAATAGNPAGAVPVESVLQVATFFNFAGLEKQGSNNYGASTNSGTPIFGAGGSKVTDPVSGSEMTLGKVRAGFVEMSNVDLASEFTNMIITSRAFQANSRTITTSDEMLQELVNLKR